MNRKLLVLGLALLIIGLVTLPLASAQFGGGDSDNNDGSTDSGSSDDGSDSDSDTSSGSDSTDDSESTDSSSDSDSTDDSDSNSDSDSTDDSNYDGGDTENNEEETSDTDTSDNETADNQQTNDSDSTDNETSYEGGDSQNNEEESTETNYDGGDSQNNDNETSFDGGDSENNENETSFDGGDAKNNEEETDDQQEDTTSSEDDTSEDENTNPAPEDGSNNTENDQNNGNEEEKQPDEEDSSPDTGSGEDDSDGGGFSPTNYIIEAVSQNSLQAEVNPDTIQIGESATVSGSLTGDDISNKQIEILVDGQKTTTFTNEDGEFEKEVTLTTVGDKEINVKQDDLEEGLSLKVTPTVRIFSMHTSLEKTPGEPIEVCADIISQTDAELTLYHNDQTHNSKNGRGELCFNPTLEQGENQFQAVAVVEGDRDKEELTRSAHTYKDEPTTLGPSTGSFLSSTTGIVAGAGILIAIIGGIIAKRRGINPLGTLT